MLPEALSTGYTAFHGDPGGILVGRTRISLDDLAEMIDGRGQRRVLHSASCATIDLPTREINHFLKATSLRAVCGYLDEVDFLERGSVRRRRSTRERRRASFGNPAVGAGGDLLPGESVTHIATIVDTGAEKPPTPTGDVSFDPRDSTELDSSGLFDTPPP